MVHCPYCHGWEIRDQPIGVHGNDATRWVYVQGAVVAEDPIGALQGISQNVIQRAGPIAGPGTSQLNS